MYYAHRNKNGDLQTLPDHLNNVAKRAGCFAKSFGRELEAYQAGKTHDTGKSSNEFQKRLFGGPAVDHSTAGAKEFMKLKMLSPAFCVAGHHTGLPDMGNRGDSDGLPTLQGRLKRNIPKYELTGDKLNLKYIKEPEFTSGFDFAFYTRMIFSCVVDADFLDTADFMDGRVPFAGSYDSLETDVYKRQPLLWKNTVI